jgi:hypothetical protein
MADIPTVGEFEALLTSLKLRAESRSSGGSDRYG